MRGVCWNESGGSFRKEILVDIIKIHCIYSDFLKNMYEIKVSQWKGRKRVLERKDGKKGAQEKWLQRRMKVSGRNRDTLN